MTPPSPDNLREEVARIIDPTAFEPTTGRVPIQLQKDALAKADAILSLPALSVPEGWVAVPREPTEEMIEAHFEAHARAETVFADVPVIWEAMLSAIPSPGGEGSSRPWPIDGAGNLGSAVASGDETSAPVEPTPSARHKPSPAKPSVLPMGDLANLLEREARHVSKHSET